MSALRDLLGLPEMNSYAILGAGGHARAVRDVLLEIYGQELPMFENDADVPQDAIVFIGVGNRARIGDSDLSKRMFLFAKFEKQVRGFVAPTAVVRGIVSPSSQIMPGAVINVGSSVGANSLINTSVVVEHDCRVGEHCHVAPGAVLCGEVRVGNYAHIGAGAVVKQGITIGRNCVVGMGLSVRRDLKDNETYLGVAS